MKKILNKLDSKKVLMILGTVFLVICLVFGYFTTFNNRQPDPQVSLELKGSELINLYVGEPYNEPGYVASSDLSGNINQHVRIIGNVDTQREGTYDILYKLNYNGVIIEKHRTVKVSKKPVSDIEENQNESNNIDDDGNNKPAVDNQKPEPVVDKTTLKLNGSAEVYLLQGSDYIENGAVAVTESGVDVSNKIVINGSVDTNKPGTYRISYTVSDSLGGNITLTRKVNILKMEVSSFLTPNNKTNMDVILNLSITADKFSYVLLPNGRKVKSNNVEYMITKNGKYSFLVFNDYGLMRKYTYSINNIDRVSPRGSCSGYTKDGKSYINIAASDDSGILKYRLNGKDYTSNNIILDKIINKPTITIYDTVGNTKDISCTLENKSIIYKKEFSLKSYSSSHGSSFQYWLNVPEGTREQMPILVFLHGDGEVGNINALKELYQIQYIVNQYKGDPFVLIAPLTNIKSWISGSIPASLIDLINNVANTYNSDYSRIYIIGFSRGAIGTWNLVNMYPNYFAAAMPVSCCPAGGNNPNNFTKTKIKAVVGTVGVEATYKSCMSPFVNEIKGSGGSAELITYNGASHSTISRTIDYDSLYSWMLQQKK